ncbi:uncharacterized protein LOC106159074 [Lingula anatina]|uniref:Uncharacterized protein LOC106159074 n=1 Tax=Lingula anatina TaxID=7574 RepID=A0A1S3HXE8_LINAN|nr:uncharacterized protein LOC106159074 [Lingula anatina]XP_013390708.1 uncharacterized protein LOC106159074 [Lingula anatina]|eukprot:XP_013390707.1 uncharacterized protein LOC106159074 [Lingula anatina]
MQKTGTTTRTTEKKYTIRLLRDDQNEIEHVWEMVVRNMSRAMISGVTLKGIRQPLVIAAAFTVFALLYRYLGDFAMSGAITIVVSVCVCLVNTYYGLYYGLYSDKLCPEAGQNMFAYYGKERRRCWVAESDRKIIAAVGIQEKTSTDNSPDAGQASVAVLQRLVVEPEYRRMGVADALIKTALEFCKEHNYEEVILATSEVQHDVMRYYYKRGFVEIRHSTFDDLFPLFELKMHVFRLDLKDGSYQ